MRIEEALARAKRLYGAAGQVMLLGFPGRGCYLLGASDVVLTTYSLDETFVGALSFNVERARAAVKSLKSDRLIAIDPIPGGVVFHGDKGRYSIEAERPAAEVAEPQFDHLPWQPFDSWPSVRATLHSVSNPKAERPAYEAVRAVGGQVWATDGTAVTCAAAPELRYTGVSKEVMAQLLAEDPARAAQCTVAARLPAAALRGVAVDSRAELVDDAARLWLRFDAGEVRVIRREAGWFPEITELQAQWSSNEAFAFEPAKLAHASLEASRAAKKWLDDNPGAPAMVEVSGEPNGLCVQAGGFFYRVELPEAYAGEGYQTRSWRYDPKVFHEAVRAHRQNARAHAAATIHLRFGERDADPLVFQTPNLTEAIYPILVVDDGAAKV